MLSVYLFCHCKSLSNKHSLTVCEVLEFLCFAGWGNDMVVTLYGCCERTYPLFSHPSLSVWHDGACAVIWRTAIIPQLLPSRCKLETTFCLGLTLFVPFFSVQLTNFLPFQFCFYHFVMLDVRGQGFGSFLCWRVVICHFTVGKLYSGAIYSCGFVRTLRK